MWFMVIVLIVVIGVIAVVASGRGESMAQVYDDRPDRMLPGNRPLTADDLSAISFSTGFRGYRMDEVDAFIDRVQADLLARETAGATAAPQPAASPPPGDSCDDPQTRPAEDSDRPPPAAGPANPAPGAAPPASGSAVGSGTVPASHDGKPPAEQLDGLPSTAEQHDG
jgi:DivIVA domain-containing protein